MKIAFVSHYYPPETNAPANRVSGLARRWVEQGAEVTVITGYPNHPEGRVYPGYDARRSSREQDGGVEVFRTPIYTAANRGVLLRSAAFGSFFASAASVARLKVPRPDLVVATSPQLLAGVAGAWLAKTWRVPFVLEVRDLWPDSVVAVGALREGSMPVRLLRQIEKRLYRQADRIVVVTETFQSILQERGVPASKLRFVPNGVDRELFHTGAALPEDPWPGRFVVSFVGTVGMAHGLGTLLEAAALLKHRPDILFLVVGEGAERADLEARAKAEGLDNVRFLGRRPRHEVPGILARSDVSLVMLKDDPLFKTVLPSKMFEAMGCGRPILLGVDGEARRLLDRAQAGVFFNPGDPRALAEAVETLQADPARRRELGRNGARFVVEHFDRTELADRYLADLTELARAEGAIAAGT